MTEIFDTHAHYDDRSFDGDREELLQALPMDGVGKVVDVGSSLASCKAARALAEQYDYIYCALGVHPGDTAELTEESIDWLRKQCRYEKCVAVGEIGLDYYWDEPEHDIQKKWFVRQLDLARECEKPVVIHSRDAAKDTVDIMTAEKCREIGGVIHCFSYTKETARTFLDMGFYIGIGGVLTFKNAKKMVEVAEYVPMERIVLETDCPYLAPVPYRGKRNCSIFISYVVEALAQIKGLSEEEVRRIVWKNAHELYRIQP
ncbi:MAG: TatD family hydrolase [Lachnospiraceae bacterium]|nr:TatD family hydrolase [Butyrivibrio sp.]MCM1344521.1 TatD family hydrolase [Muribaculaceae bacterium]MCM1409367.1 TatD family hydrolase [Lachnospiraceae bacterium]